MLPRNALRRQYRQRRVEVTHKYSFDFGFGAEESHVEEFAVGRVWRYTPSGIKDVGQEKRGEDSKKCRG